MNIPYNDVLDNAREAARDFLRLKAANAWKTKRLTMTNQLDRQENEEARLTKAMAIARYELDHLDTAHPDYEDQKKQKDEWMEDIKKAAEKAAKEKETILKEIAAIDERIAKWFSGETKVNMDELQSVAETFLKNVVIDNLKESLK